MIEKNDIEHQIDEWKKRYKSNDSYELLNEWEIDR
jgi:hypothetical protein